MKGTSNTLHCKVENIKMRLNISKPQGIDIFHEVLFALSGTRSAFTSYQTVNIQLLITIIVKLKKKKIF